MSRLCRPEVLSGSAGHVKDWHDVGCFSPFSLWGVGHDGMSFGSVTLAGISTRPYVQLEITSATL